MLLNQTVSCFRATIVASEKKWYTVASVEYPTCERKEALEIGRNATEQSEALDQCRQNLTASESRIQELEAELAEVYEALEKLSNLSTAACNGSECGGADLQKTVADLIKKNHQCSSSRANCLKDREQCKNESIELKAEVEQLRAAGINGSNDGEWEHRYNECRNETKECHKKYDVLNASMCKCTETYFECNIALEKWKSDKSMAQNESDVIKESCTLHNNECLAVKDRCIAEKKSMKAMHQVCTDLNAECTRDREKCVTELGESNPKTAKIHGLIAENRECRKERDRVLASLTKGLEKNDALLRANKKCFGKKMAMEVHMQKCKVECENAKRKIKACESAKHKPPRVIRHYASPYVILPPPVPPYVIHGPPHRAPTHRSKFNRKPGFYWEPWEKTYFRKSHFVTPGNISKTKWSAVLNPKPESMSTSKNKHHYHWKVSHNSSASPFSLETHWKPSLSLKSHGVAALAPKHTPSPLNMKSHFSFPAEKLKLYDYNDHQKSSATTKPQHQQKVKKHHSLLAQILKSYIHYGLHKIGSRGRIKAQPQEKLKTYFSFPAQRLKSPRTIDLDERKTEEMPKIVYQDHDKGEARATIVDREADRGLGNSMKEVAATRNEDERAVGVVQNEDKRAADDADVGHLEKKSNEAQSDSI